MVLLFSILCYVDTVISMNITETLYVTDRDSWREWLENNYKTASEIWLLYPKKNSDKPRITYNDAVEEALCFGWIDSIEKTLDEIYIAQRFSPRKAIGSYSQPNIERMKKLYTAGKLLPEVEEQVAPILNKPFVFPDDIIESIKKNKQAWENYKNFSPPYQRIRIAYIDSARKRPEEFSKRLQNFIKKTEQNKQIGYGGIEAYY
jgi:uncharacterized protein YdeI (YjbR/CyaY-like superfamily)